MLPKDEKEARKKHVGALINNNIVQQFGVKYNALKFVQFFCNRIKPIRDKQLKNKGTKVQITSEVYNPGTRLKNVIKQIKTALNIFRVLLEHITGNKWAPDR